jgi:hypothetical protein
VLAQVITEFVQDTNAKTSRDIFSAKIRSFVFLINYSVMATFNVMMDLMKSFVQSAPIQTILCKAQKHFHVNIGTQDFQSVQIHVMVMTIFV